MQPNETSHARPGFSLAALRKTFRLYRYVKPYWPQFFAGMLCLLLASSASLFFPKYLGQLVQVASGKTVIIQQITTVGLTLILLLVAQAAFSFLRTILFVAVTEKTLAALREHVYHHLVRLPMAFFANRRVGELTSRISSDISLLQETFTTTIAELVRQVVIVAGGLVLLFHISTQLTFFMLSIVPVISILALVFGKFIRGNAKLVQTQVSEANTIVEETLQGILNVKAFTNEDFEVKRYHDKTQAAARTGMRVGRFRGMFSSFFILGIFGAMVAVIWKGALLIAAHQLQTGPLFSFVIYSGFIGGAIAGLADVYATLQKSMGATEHLLDILDVPTEAITVQKMIPPAYQLKGGVAFNNVSFHYPSRPDVPVLDQVSFRVEPDQRIALVGPSGAGKSTLVSLLLRLYDPVSGAVRFDDLDATGIPLSALRGQIAVVPQDVFLFGGSIRENIAYGDPQATEADIMWAANQANAWEFIQRFPDGLDTIVGERGVQLSGGQRQRIAIARAVLKDPRILILDEATSALDAASEQLVQDALDKLMQGRTAIVIAHRLATIRQADHIVVLDKGRVVEQGSHAWLVAQEDGLYKTLSEMQFIH